MTALPRFAVFAACAALVFATGTADVFAATGKSPQTKNASDAQKQRVGIAAVVNDDIITFNDIDDRMKLYMLGAPQNLPAEARQRLLQQAVFRLVDEKLQMQEAKSLNIEVARGDIEQGFTAIAAQNKMDADHFRKALSHNGVNLNTIEDQIKAEIAWSQVVRRRLRPQITISENEIDTEVDRLQRGSGRTEYRLAEIFLPFDGPATEKNARELAEKLIGEIAKGRPFSNAAREFSEAPGAAKGGDMGWIEEGILAPEIETAIQNLQPGQLSTPVRTAKGYYVMFLRESRQKGMPTAAAAPAPAVEAAPRPGLISSDDSVPVSELRNVSAPKIITGEEVSAPDTAETTARKGDEAQREEVASRLGLQRLEQMAERYLRDLRATAFIEQRF